jgi:hypothetical protein
MPSTPASVSMTAASGSELSGMLKDIMSLAGMHKVDASHLGFEHPPVKISAEPVKAVGPVASDAEVMRGIADKMNVDKDESDEKKADESFDSAPASPQPPKAFDAEEFADHPNPPGAGKGRGLANNPNATLEDILSSLSEEYQAFKNAVNEDEEVEEAKDEEVDEEKSWFDMDSKERAAHVASGKSKAHRSGGQPGHGTAPAKTSAGDVKKQAADTKSELGKQDYKGKEDDFSE